MRLPSCFAFQILFYVFLPEIISLIIHRILTKSIRLLLWEEKEIRKIYFRGPDRKQFYGTKMKKANSRFAGEMTIGGIIFLAIKIRLNF